MNQVRCVVNDRHVKLIPVETDARSIPINQLFSESLVFEDIKRQGRPSAEGTENANSHHPQTQALFEFQQDHMGKILRQREQSESNQEVSTMDIIKNFSNQFSQELLKQNLDQSETDSKIFVPVPPNAPTEEDDIPTMPKKKKDKGRRKPMMDLDMEDIIFSEGRSKRSRTAVPPPTIPDSNIEKRSRGHRGPGKSKKSPLEFQLDKRETELSKQVTFS